MDASSRWRHWFLAAVILGLSSSLAAGEPLEQRSLESDSAVDYPPLPRGDETNRTGLAGVRRRRYVRFPTGPAYVLESGGPPAIGRNLGSPHPATRFAPQFSGSWRQQKSLWRSPVIADYNRPVMSHRTPRLIFRDNDFLPPAGASFFQQSNQLPDFEDDVRGKALPLADLCARHAVFISAFRGLSNVRD